MELLSSFLQIDVGAFLAERFTPLDNSEFWKLGEAVDETLGNSFAEVLGVRIATRVNERQHRQRLDALACPRWPRRQWRRDHSYTAGIGIPFQPLQVST